MLTQTAQGSLGVVFKAYREFLRDAIYHRGASSPMNCKMLVMPIRPALLFGNKIDANDEEIYIAAADLAAVQPLQPGDTIIDYLTTQSRTVITAHLDTSGTVWAFVARKTFS